MRSASKSRGVAKILVRPALWFCACNLLAAALAAQCTNPTPVPNQTISSGTPTFSDNNALSASNVVINGSASVTFVAGHCIQLLPGFHATAGTAGTTFHAWVETAPADVSVSPSSGSGLNQPFTWTVSSPSGYTNLSDIFALFNTSVSGANACYIHYNRASNLLYLADSSGVNWSSGIVPGNSGTTGNFNPYCTVNGSGSGFSPSGTQLAVTVSVTFQTSFAGPKNEYLIGYDNQGLNTTWQQMGTWTVPVPTEPITVTSNLSGLSFLADGVAYPSPQTCQWVAGSNHTIGVSSPQSGGVGTQYVFANWSDGGASTHNVTVPYSSASYTANFTTQYQLTTSVSPAGAGTITPATGGWYNSGSSVPVSASGSGLYQFSNFSGTNSGATNPLTVTMTGPTNETANFVVVVPAAWKGITYAPRNHPFWRMLYEYYDYDSTLGEYVYQAVDSDLALLSCTGPNAPYPCQPFNLVHLYVWDHALLDFSMLGRWCKDGAGLYYRGCTPPYGYDPGGFVNSNVSPYPTQTPAHDPSHTQGQALDDFVTRAENHGLYVMIHFADGTLFKEVSTGSQYNYTDGSRATASTLYCGDPNPQSPWYNPQYNQCASTNAPGVAAEFNAWTGDFISLLARININGPAHHNLMAFGFEYSFPDLSYYADTVTQTAYPAMLSQLSAYRSALPGRGLMSMDLGFGVNPVEPPSPLTQGMYLRPAGGYTWGIGAFAQVAALLPAGHPDLWTIQGYNPNAADMSIALSDLVSHIPASKLMISEFATSSSISSTWNTPYLAFLFITYGDSDTPTGTQNDQAAWTADTLCALAQNNISKFAYWTMYDAPSFWNSAPWYMPDLNWWGYWGLGNEAPSAGMKPVFNTLAAYNPAVPSCPVYSAPVAPVVSVSAIASYVTVNENPRFAWTVANSSGMTVNGATSSPKWIADCSAGFFSWDDLSQTPILDQNGNKVLTWGGSCAQGFGAPTSQPGTAYYTFQVQGMNGATPYTTTIPISVGYSPIISYVNGQPWSGQTVSASGSSYFNLSGQGFNFFYTNLLLWISNNGYPAVYMYNGDGSGDYFYQADNAIIAYLGGRLAPGSWSVYACNGVGGAYCSVIPVQIY